MSQNESTSASSTVWNINGLQFELDMQDVETTERYETTFAKMGEAEKSQPKDGKQSERIRAYCMMFRNLFDGLFGDGTSDKIFGDVNNARIMTEVYENFLEFVSNQQVAVVQTQNRIANRFSPNRAQRRQSEKKH